ncbi:MAG: helix-turn-helix domain-containing protein [Reyranella sp.]|uniref:helix-turn-helix domain-containing protein n=1 Tax=Reyranella sp. TaxID=1929291 RepID=UPI001AC784D1|nr:helix-turn-helix domain-containing protein [Reyranella sp.]MBN9086039.1 helix-turn-helix domain-containing protein [Reyranella sp.]
MGEAAKLPFSLFTTEHLRPRDQFDAWRASISVIFDVEPLHEHRSESGFDASVRAWHLGGLVVSQVDFDGQRFVREKARAARDGLDHYLVQLYAVGGLVGTAEDRERLLRAGDVQILDLSRPNATKTKASGTIAIVVPRDTLRQALPTAGDLHGLVLRGDSGAGGLLTDYMRSLIARADAITTAAAPLIAHATTEMIAACFHTTAETLARAQTPIEAMTLARIQRHIADSLDSPELHPEALCRAFGISRTQLYRLFERLGGVAIYIQEQRLARAYAELSNPARIHRRIYDIAFDWGFSSEAHFSRVFRRAFGMSPSDARAHAHGALAGLVQPDATAPMADGDGGYEEWVRRLRSR